MEREAMDQKIWTLLDNGSDTQELTSIRELIETDVRWQQRYDELLSLHRQLAALEPEQPSMRFVQNVMDNIAAQQAPVSAQSYINMRIVKSIAAVFLVVIAVLFLYGLSAAGGLSLTAEMSDERSMNMSSSGNAIQLFVFGNILLLLLFFDKVSEVLLRKRRNEG